MSSSGMLEVASSAGRNRRNPREEPARSTTPTRYTDILNDYMDGDDQA